MDPKCTVCKKTKPAANFLKNGKTLKSCIGCREKRTKQNVMSPAVVVKSDKEIHKECMQKMNQEFREKAAFPVHQYLMRWIFVDIRDTYRPSEE